MIRKELPIFLVIGTSTVVMDYATYTVLLKWTAMAVDPAKGLGFLTGTVYAYFANRIWTFGHTQAARGSAWRFAQLYALTLGANVLINAGVLRLLGTWTMVHQLAFFMATGVSATLNFLGMKLYVFQAAHLHQAET
jgi:putative flippase GtrA